MSKRIRARVEINGVVKWVAGATQQEAIIAAAKLLADANGECGNDQSKREAPLFRDYAQTWFDTYKKPSLRIKAVTDYGLNLKKHLMPFFGNMRIDEIKVLDVQQFMNTKMDMAFSTVHKYKVMLNQIFCSAIEDGWRTDNPINSKRIKLPKRTKEREALTLEDAKDIISSWYLLGERERRLLALYLYAGVRRGEALALKYGDIDRARGLIRIERGVVFKDNQPIVGEPKTKAAKRFIPIMDKSLLEIIPDGEPEAFIIGGDKPITETCYKRMWDRIEKTINMHGATAHVLRHTYATMAAGTGIDPKTLQSIMGHADIQTTMNRYAHKRMDKIEEAKETLKTMYL